MQDYGAGIYMITNKITGKKYIGQSRDLKRRRRDYIRDNKRDLRYIMKDIRRFGIGNFEFKVIEKCKVEELNKREVYWIDREGTYIKGYNKTKGGSHPKYRGFTEEEIDEIYCDLESGDMGIQEIAKKYGISDSMVYRINKGTNYHRDSEVYPKRETLSIASKKRGDTVCKDCKTVIGKGSKRCLGCYKKFRIKEIPTKEYLIEEVAKKGYERVGRENNVTGNAVRKWCKKRGLPHEVGEIRKIYGNYKTPKGKSKGKREIWKNIYCKTPEGEERKFESINELINYIYGKEYMNEKEIKNIKGAIYKALQGKTRSHKGYIIKGTKGN